MSTINQVFFSLSPSPTRVDASIAHQEVTVEHAQAIPAHTIHSVLEDAGFDVSSPDVSSSEHTLSQATQGMSSDKRRKHIQYCLLCREADDIILQENTGRLSSNGASSTAHSTLEEPDRTLGLFHNVGVDDVALLVTLSVGGMTCSACSGSITDTVSQLPGVSEVVVSLLNNSATVIVARKDLIDSVTETIDDCGFEVDVVKIEPLIPLTSTHNETTTGPRKLSLRVDGMHCECVNLLVVASRVTDICESDFVQPKS